MNGRKKLFVATTLLAAVVTAVAAAGAFSAAGKQRPKTAAQQLKGTWLSKVTLDTAPPGGDKTFIALDTFLPGGGLLVSSSQTRPATRSLAHGDCTRSGNRTFECRFMWFRFDAAGSFVGTQRVRRTMTVAADLQTWESDDVVEVVAPDGTVVASTHATETASRLGA
jgi:hypothetical protein